MHTVFRHYPLEKPGYDLHTSLIAMSGANWQLASCKKFRIWINPIILTTSGVRKGHPLPLE